MRSAAHLPVLLLCAALAGATGAQEIEIRGRVVSGDGTGAAGVELALYPLTSPYDQALLELAGSSLPEPESRVTTDSSGQYRLTASEAGFWRLVVSHRGALTMQRLFEREPLLEPIALPDLELRPAREIRVTVERPDGEPASGAWVESWLTDNRAPARTDAWAPYTPPKRWTEADSTVVVPADAEIELQAWQAGWRASPKAAAPGGSAKLRLRPAIARVVALRESDGAAVADAAAREGEVEWPVGRSDESGVVRVHGDAEEASARILTSDGRSTRLRLTGDEGRDGKPFELRLAPHRTVAGMVLDADSRRPIPGAFVYPVGAVGRWVRADARGGFVLPVAAGRQQWLTAAAPGYLTDSITAAAEAHEATLALRPATDLPGRVVDAGGDPLADVEIVVRPHGETRRQYRAARRAGWRRAVSDAGGAFLLPRLSREVSHAVIARLTGFAPSEQIVRDVVASAAGGGVTLVLDRGTTLHGRIVGPDGRAVGGAAVTLERTSGEEMPRSRRPDNGQPEPFRFELASGPEGEFVLADTPAGDFEMEVRAAGFAHHLVPTFEIEKGERDHDLGEITLEAGIEIYGRVVDPDGLPLAGARISLSTAQRAGFSVSREAEQRTLTAGDGSFTIADRRRGEFVDLEVELSGFASESVPRVEVPPEPPFEIILQPAVTLAGTVIDPQGQPISGATIAVSREGGGSSYGGRVYTRPDAWGRTDELGRFRVVDVEPGKVRVQASASGWLPTQLGDVELEAGREPETLTLELRPGATVSGRVLGPDGKPASDAVIALRDIDSIGFSGARADGDGGYTLSGVEPGLRRVGAYHEGSEMVQEIEVEEGDNRLDFYFEAGAEVSGTVVAPGGEPIEGAVVSLSEIGSSTYRPGLSAETDAAGRFAFDNIEPGSFQVTANHPDYGAAVVSEPVDVSAAPVTGLLLRLTTGVTLRGSVTGVEADELVHLEVVAMQQRGAIYKRGRVDSDAGYRIDNLSPGSWTVWAQSKTGLQTSEALEIADGDTEVIVDLEFEQGLILAGQVLKQGEAVAGAWIVISGHETSDGTSAQSDHQGRFRLAGLRAGTYTLQISSFDSGLSHREEVELLRDDTIVVELGGAAIAGRVADVRGTPIQGASLILESLAENEGDLWRGPPPGATTDAAGRYRIVDVSPGSYRLRAAKAGYATQAQALDLDEALDGIDFALAEVEGLSLTLAMPDQVPVSSLTYSLRDLAGNRLQGGWERATTDGLVRLAGVPDGEWELLVQAPGAAVHTLRTQTPRDDLVVQLERAATVTVRVPEIQGDSSTVATLRVMGVDGRRYEALDWNGRVQDHWRLWSGQAELEHLSPGRWILSVTTTDDRSWERSVRLEAGVNDEVVLD